MPEIIVTINPDGSTVIEGQNFKGAGCEQATAAIEKALGTASSRKLKPEYHQKVGVNTNITIK